MHPAAGIFIYLFIYLMTKHHSPFWYQLKAKPAGKSSWYRSAITPAKKAATWIPSPANHRDVNSRWLEDGKKRTTLQQQTLIFCAFFFSGLSL